MIPVLYDKYETDFLSNGLGQLGDCLTCIVTEEVNGIYELELTYPMTGAYYEQLINFGGVVACTHDHNGDIQLFDIYKYSAPIDGIVTFYGSHVSYRLSDYIRNVEGVLISPAYAFDLWNNETAHLMFYPPASSFTFYDYSGYEEEEGYYLRVLKPYSVRSAMLSTEENSEITTPEHTAKTGSIVQLWKGEWQFDKFAVNYYKKRGADRGVQIRYGKNMVGVERARDTGGLVSVIVPYYDTGAYLPRQYANVYSPYMEHVITPWELNVEQAFSSGEKFYLCPAELHPQTLYLNDVFNSEPTQAQVNKYCRDYMSKNSTWRAEDNITVEFLDLYGTPEYEGIEGLSNCLCGDYVSILYPQLGIVSDGVEIMSLTYDVLAERVVEMQLNTIRTTLAQVIIDTIGGTK